MKFSIVVPTFNSADTIVQTIESVQQQTYQNWELIIVDDRSDDFTENVITAYSKWDDKIKFFKRPEDRMKGGNACRNIGLEHSEGDYIALLDSDDHWENRRLEHVFEFIESKDPSALYSGAVISMDSGFFKRLSRPLEFDESVFDFLVRHDTFSPTPSLVVKSEIAKKIKFDEELKRHQDFDFFIRVSKICSWIYFENWEVIVNWRSKRDRKINYESCLLFYKKHSHLSKNTAIRHSYIMWLVECSVKEEPNTRITGFYKRQLQLDNYDFNPRQKLLFSYPRVFNVLYRLKKLLSWKRRSWFFVILLMTTLKLSS